MNNIIHFLNVKEGDCTLIQHKSGRNTLIDICNGNSEDVFKCGTMDESFYGNFNQKSHPVNPIEYLKKFNIKTIFRFILTHPDMDHMDGIKRLFREFDVINFWDTGNNKEIDENDFYGQYNKNDWSFYQSLRNNDDYNKLYLTNNCSNPYYNMDYYGGRGDSLYILSPTQKLINYANIYQEYNELSYVILYLMGSRKIIFAGDSGEEAWDSILNKYHNDIRDIDILLAPHHGRKSGGNDYYLDILKPKLTLFGNAKSKYLDYNAWNKRRLTHITNNQAGSIIIEEIDDILKIYVTNKKFAKIYNSNLYYDEQYDAWYLGNI